MNKYVNNQFGIRIKVWCTTCEKKNKCGKIGRDKDQSCWEMNDKYQNAGNGHGVVRELMIKDSPLGKTFEFSDNVII